MDPKNSLKISYDPAQNLVLMSYVGRVGVPEVQGYEAMIVTALASTPRGFYLLTDLSDLESMDILCEPYIKKIMEQFRKRGVARVVRLIPDPRKDIGFNIMSLFHYPRGMKIMNCSTKEEAEEALK